MKMFSLFGRAKEKVETPRATAIATRVDENLEALFPIEFDASFYKENNADLQGLATSELWDHYLNYGRNEGRSASPRVGRQKFVEALQIFERALEIGPFSKPILKQRTAKFFDVLSKNDLQKRASEIGENAHGVPEIEFVSPVGDLSIINSEFDLVVSSHAVEHQPDLVRHLNDVSKILKTGGCYALIIPDCRYCFDHFIAPSHIGDVLEAHLEKRQLHTLSSVIEHRALTTHNDSSRHWIGDSDQNDLQLSRLKIALKEWEEKRGQYIDVHAWQFTPKSFKEIIGALWELSYTTMSVMRVYDTPFGSNEFCAVLRKE